MRWLILALLVVFLLHTSAHASDYAVAYAVQFADGNDNGKIIDCAYDEYCQIELEKLQLTIYLSFSSPDHKKVHVRFLGKKIGCCYFSDGARSIDRDATEPLHRLYIYAGRERKQNEYILNTPLAILYLSFAGMK